MTDEEAIYLYLDGQVCFAFVRTVEYHRRMMEGREIETSEVNVEIGLFVCDREAFVEYFLSHGRLIENGGYCN